ncbi:hypothetical protein R6Q59_016672 [Mikania micrantha]
MGRKLSIAPGMLEPRTDNQYSFLIWGVDDWGCFTFGSNSRAKDDFAESKIMMLIADDDSNFVIV